MITTTQSAVDTRLTHAVAFAWTLASEGEVRVRELLLAVRTAYGSTFDAAAAGAGLDPQRVRSALAEFLPCPPRAPRAIQWSPSAEAIVSRALRRAELGEPGLEALLSELFAIGPVEANVTNAFIRQADLA